MDDGAETASGRVLPPLPPLRDVIRAHGLRAEKSLGQNFLLDLNITEKIVRLAGVRAGQSIIEIGPGPGGLTRALLNSAVQKIVAVEFDPRAVAALQDLKIHYRERLEILGLDALTVDPREITPAPRAIIANLPYNISTVLLLKWLKMVHENIGENAADFDFFALMFQKEVAERLTAKPGTKDYGRLSVMAQWLCEIKKLFDLPPSAFTPPPKVRSSVLHFKPRKFSSPQPKFETMEAILQSAFGQRRKMIRGSLSGYAVALEKSGIDTTLRAEDLSVEQYVQLSLLS